MASILWLLAGILVCTVVFTMAEAMVFFILHGRLSQIAGERIRVIEPLDPLTIDFPIGLTKLSAPISKDNLRALESAYSHLAPILFTL